MKAGLFPTALALLLAACKPAPAPTNVAEAIPTSIAVPEKGAYLGAYIDSGDDEDDVSLDRLVEFEELAGKKQAIVASSSYWGQQDVPFWRICASSRGTAAFLCCSGRRRTSPTNKTRDRTITPSTPDPGGEVGCVH